MNTHLIKKAILSYMAVAGLSGSLAVAAPQQIAVRGGGNIQAGQQYFVGHHYFSALRDRELRRNWGLWEVEAALGTGYYSTSSSYDRTVTTVIAPLDSVNPVNVPPGMYYYCDSAGKFYPYVAQCAEPWRPVQSVPE